MIMRMEPIITILLLFLSYLLFFQVYIKVCTEYMHVKMQKCVEKSQPPFDGNTLSISILQMGKLRPSVAK